MKTFVIILSFVAACSVHTLYADTLSFSNAPNPAREYVKSTFIISKNILILRLSQQFDMPVRVTVSDSKHDDILTKKQSVKGLYKYEIDFSALPSGIYNLEIIVGNSTINSCKVMKTPADEFVFLQ